MREVRQRLEHYLSSYTAYQLVVGLVALEGLLLWVSWRAPATASGVREPSSWRFLANVNGGLLSFAALVLGVERRSEAAPRRAILLASFAQLLVVLLLSLPLVVTAHTVAHATTPWWNHYLLLLALCWGLVGTGYVVGGYLSGTAAEVVEYALLAGLPIAASGVLRLPWLGQLSPVVAVYSQADGVQGWPVGAAGYVLLGGLMFLLTVRAEGQQESSG
ncbi:MAG: hypothetical protein HY335_00115 [Deinococcus sp.]|nr:hypothetical protein [Deinococcus sp.]